MTCHKLFVSLLLCTAALTAQGQIQAQGSPHVPLQAFLGVLNSNPAAASASLARFLTAGIQGLRLVGKANPDRRALEDIAAVMLRCVKR